MKHAKILTTLLMMLGVEALGSSTATTPAIPADAPTGMGGAGAASSSSLYAYSGTAASVLSGSKEGSSSRAGWHNMLEGFGNPYASCASESGDAGLSYGNLYRRMFALGSCIVKCSDNPTDETTATTCKQNLCQIAFPIAGTTAEAHVTNKAQTILLMAMKDPEVQKERRADMDTQKKALKAARGLTKDSPDYKDQKQGIKREVWSNRRNTPLKPEHLSKVQAYCGPIAATAGAAPISGPY